MIAAKDLFPRAVHYAEKYVGTSRESDPGQIARFLAVFDLPFSEGGVPIPFCAAGSFFADAKAWLDMMSISYTHDTIVDLIQHVALPVFKEHYYFPGASVGAMVVAAQARGQWLGMEDAGEIEILPGWKVCFSFSPSDHHIEVVRADLGDELDTVGFNTTCEGHTGIVADKRRNWDRIWGFIKTY